uniref:aminoacyl--tRNA ligase-related protein n=1 Tax=Microbacterium sp. TaxID=51671 RepID=UPI003457C998
LVGTSEVALAGYHKDEIVDLAGGALRYAGWSTCYRREAGSYGKDTRGIIRVHQFNKLEMFVYTDPDDAEAEHLRLVALQEEMLTALGLSYRVIDVAAGDLGSSAARKYDIEAWVPTQEAFRELTSTSNCTTFQARRLDVRYRPGASTGSANGEGGSANGQVGAASGEAAQPAKAQPAKTQPVATLNGTLATTRWIVALLETHQQADGSVIVPEALRPYLGGLEVLEPKK